MRLIALDLLRYTKLALLLFGLGLVLGFVAVVGELPPLERFASTAMALGLLAIPVALFADGHGLAFVAWLTARFRRGKRTKPRRKPAARKPGARRRPAQRRSTRSPRRG